MDKLCPLNCNLKLKLLLVIQLVPQTLNYAKSPTCIDFVLLGCIFKACGKAGERNLEFPILWKSNADPSTSASLSPTGQRLVIPGGFLCSVWHWVHQGSGPACCTQCRSPNLFQDAVFSSLPFSTSYMTGSIRDLSQGKPSKKWEYCWNSSGLDLLAPEQHFSIISIMQTFVKRSINLWCRWHLDMPCDFVVCPSERSTFFC